jgi:hypothetical protein
VPPDSPVTDQSSRPSHLPNGSLTVADRVITRHGNRTEAGVAIFYAVRDNREFEVGRQTLELSQDIF